MIVHVNSINPLCPLMITTRYDNIGLQLGIRYAPVLCNIPPDKVCTRTVQ